MSMHRINTDQARLQLLSVFAFAEQDSGFELSLIDGHVEMKDSTTHLRSTNRYDEGRWHYVTAFRNSTR